MILLSFSSFFLPHLLLLILPTPLDLPSATYRLARTYLLVVLGHLGAVTLHDLLFLQESARFHSGLRPSSLSSLVRSWVRHYNRSRGLELLYRSNSHLNPGWILIRGSFISLFLSQQLFFLWQLLLQNVRLVPFNLTLILIMINCNT